MRKDGLKYHIMIRHAEQMVDHVQALMEKNVENAALASEKASLTSEKAALATKSQALKNQNEALAREVQIQSQWAAYVSSELSRRPV